MIVPCAYLQYVFTVNEMAVKAGTSISLLYDSRSLDIIEKTNKKKTKKKLTVMISTCRGGL